MMPNPNQIKTTEIVEDFHRISLELHFFLYILPLLAQNFQLFTGCSYRKTDLTFKNGNFAQIPNLGSEFESWLFLTNLGPISRPKS